MFYRHFNKRVYNYNIEWSFVPEEDVKSSAGENSFGRKAIQSEKLAKKTSQKAAIPKCIFTAVLVLLSLFVLCACGNTAQTEETADTSLPTLKIGVDMLKPFFYIDENGDNAGIDAEIAAEACRRAGYTPVFISVSWSDRDEYLQDGRIDCLWSAFIKNGREDAYRWTETYMQSNLRAITDIKSPDKDISAAQRHGGMAVRAGSKLEEILLNDTADFPAIHVYSCGTFEMAETALIKGYAGALGGHEAVLQQVIDSYPNLYRFLDGNIMTTDLAVAFAKDDDSEEFEKINAAIKEMKADGTIADILQKYHVNTSDSGEAAANDEK